MKMKLLMLMLATTLVSHAQDMKSWPDACGKDTIQFKVKTSKSTPAALTPDPGKAKIVFVEVIEGDFSSAPTARMALDGSWVGADKGDSYFAVSIDPGQHHVCASRQSGVRDEKANVGLVNVNAEPGKVYFYEFRIRRSEIGNAAMQGGAALPGQYPGSMDAKPHPTIDTAEFKELSMDEFQTMQHKLSVGVSNIK